MLCAFPSSNKFRIFSIIWDNGGTLFWGCCFFINILGIICVEDVFKCSMRELIVAFDDVFVGVMVLKVL